MISLDPSVLLLQMKSKRIDQPIAKAFATGSPLREELGLVQPPSEEPVDDFVNFAKASP